MADNGAQVGLLQVDYESHRNRVEDRAALFDPEINVRVAYAVWAASNGWREPWAGCLHALG